MSEPLTRPSPHRRRPTHLRPVEDVGAAAWLARRKAAVAAGALGVAAFCVVAIVQPELWATPDWRISVPGFAVTAIAAIVSLLRREPGGYWIWAIGLALAGASLVLGWFLMIAVIVAAAVILILILHALM